MILQANAVIDPGAVMVVVENAPIAIRAMLSMWGLNSLALLAR